MIVIKPTADQRTQARKEAKEMGILNNSISNGRGNEVGMMGEILTQEHIGGSRVGDIKYSCDIILKNSLTVDVKTTIAAGVPKPNYVARVYGSEKSRDRLINKCDAYFFVRCNRGLTLATLVGWLPSWEFFDKALFLPKGSIDPNDGKLSFADEFVLPISELHPPSLKISKRRVKKPKR